MLAYTGLETVANLAEEATEPGRTLPRSLFSAIGLVVVVTVLIGAIGLSAYPVSNGETALGEEWLELPLVGIASAFDGSLPSWIVDALEVGVGVSGVLILIGAATTSFSGITRLTYSLAEHGSLPREFARLERRAVVSSEAIALAAGSRSPSSSSPRSPRAAIRRSSRASTRSASSSRSRLPSSRSSVCACASRTSRVPTVARPNVTVRGHRLPLAALVGAPLTLVIWVLSMLTHPGARYAGPVWLAIGLVVFVLVRRRRRRGLLEHVQRRSSCYPQVPSSAGSSSP